MNEHPKTVPELDADAEIARYIQQCRLMHHGITPAPRFAHAVSALADRVEEATLELRRLHEENERLREALKTYGQFAVLVAAAEREKVAAWMRSKSYATGHGDTVEDLLKELEWQVAEREREACAKVCKNEEATLLHKEGLALPQGNPMLLKMASVANFCAAAIRARGEV